MESKISDHSTPSKPLGMHDKFGLATFKTDGQFRLIKSLQTPPSRLRNIRNPFESVIHEKLHTHFSSPSVFAKVQPPKSEEKFKWTIDELSHLIPADIDEHTEQFSTPEHDPALESVAQSRIDNFFSLTEIIPSPFAQAVIESPLAKNTPPKSAEKKPNMVDNTAQTVLSLPPQLPEELENMLKPYLTYTQNQQEKVPSNNCLYRQLFEFEDTDNGRSPQTSPAKSINLNLSPIQYSPYGSANCINNCTIDSPPQDDELKDCILSPISLSPNRVSAMSSVPNMTNGKSRMRKLNSSHHMSVDISFNVPDVGDLPCNTSDGLDCSKSPQREILSDSVVHWDMEYKHISSPRSSNSSLNEMEVSTSNTPKSKIFMSQRKKLSDSFGEDMESEYKTKSSNETEFAKSDMKSDLTDAGYQTATFISSEESWIRSNLIASTPTKQLLFN